MLSIYNIKNKSQINELIVKFKKDWLEEKNKVFYFKGDENTDDVKAYYYNLFKAVGKFFRVAEDATIIDRKKQKTQNIWMEVRFDPLIKNAYRHSANAQPLHTDGSYNPSYPNSTLMCCQHNTAEKGETVFIEAKKIANILKIKNKELYKKIYNFNILHERSGDIKHSPILFKDKKNIWNVNWNYYCVSENITESENYIKNNFQNFLLNSKEIKKNLLEIKMNKGDALIWKDNEVLHGRNSFIAKENSARFIWKCAVNF